MTRPEFADFMDFVRKLWPRWTDMADDETQAVLWRQFGRFPLPAVQEAFTAARDSDMDALRPKLNPIRDKLYPGGKPVADGISEFTREEYQASRALRTKMDRWLSERTDAQLEVLRSQATLRSPWLMKLEGKAALRDNMLLVGAMMRETGDLDPGVPF